MGLLWLPVCFTGYQVPPEKGFTLKKEIAPKWSKVFPFSLDPVSEVSKNNFELKMYSFGFKHSLLCRLVRKSNHVWRVETERFSTVSLPLYNRYKTILIYFCLETPYMDIVKQCRPRSDAAERGVWLVSTLFALSTWISINHRNRNNKK